MNTYQIALIGNPNSGKTTLFNKLTGSRQRVGNWPGVTVEKKAGHYHYQHQRINVVDLPGTYSIEALNSGHGVSQDEAVVHDFVLNDSESLLVNIIDATNLQRNLYLTTQLLDLGRPMIVVLNMIDEVFANGEQINLPLLTEYLGCPVVAISAHQGQGFEALFVTIQQALEHKIVPQPLLLTLGEHQEQVIQEMLSAVTSGSTLHQLNRWQLLELLQHTPDDLSLTVQEYQILEQCRSRLSCHCACSDDLEIDIMLASARYDAIDALARQVIEKPRQASKSLTSHIDNWALGRFWGIPIFLGAMYLMFMLAINIGSAFIDFFEILVGAITVDGTKHLLQTLDSPEWLIAILANGLGGGIQTVSTFIPVIAMMFLCLSFLEDSGYLSRAAMVVDRGMRAIGLPGKAFVPMLVGFGCNVPAIMGTRTLESHRDRLMSIMMIPYMSCGARLPVYALFAAVFFPTNGQNVVFILYLVGIAVAVFTGLVLKNTILPGAITPFIMELPPYRLPTLRNLLTLTWSRLKGFILQAGKAILLMVMILSFLNSLGTDGSFGNENTDKSILTNIGQEITPAFTPMGINKQNWPATVGIFTGIFAKEAVIGTLNALYSNMGQAKTVDQEDDYNLLEKAKEALLTIPENLLGITDNLSDPFGISNQMADGDLKTVQQENEINDSAVKQIQIAFGSETAAIAYLIFILLYTPCAAALGAVYREAGAKWTLLVAIWTFVIAWVSATGFYQTSRLNIEPTTATLWLIALAALLLGLFLLLRWFGRKQRQIVLAPPKSNYTNRACH